MRVQRTVSGDRLNSLLCISTLAPLSLVCCVLPCTQNFHELHIMGGPGSVVGIATGYGLDGQGIESRWGRDFPHLSRPALGPTQPPVQWVPGFSQGWRAAEGWRWPLTSFQCRGQERVELYLYSPYGLYGLYRACAYTRVHFTSTQCLYKGALYLIWWA